MPSRPFACALVVALGGTLAVGTAAPAAAAAPTCNVSSGVLTVTIDTTVPFLGLRKDGSGNVQLTLDAAGSTTPCLSAGQPIPVADLTEVQLQQSGEAATEWRIWFRDFTSKPVRVGDSAQDTVTMMGTDSAIPDAVWVQQQMEGQWRLRTSQFEGVDIAGSPQLQFFMGAGDDIVDFQGAPVPAKVWGGPGDDEITTGVNNDEVWPGGGADFVATDSGLDIVHASAQDGAEDRVYGGSWPDTLYLETTARATYDPNTLGGDGVAGENDDYVSFEEVHSGPGGATVYAGRRAMTFDATLGTGNRFVGGPGDDVFRAAPGDPTAEFSYERSTDPVFVEYQGGGTWADYSDSDRDELRNVKRLRGGSGNDTIIVPTEVPGLQVRPGPGSDDVYLPPAGRVMAEPTPDGADDIQSAGSNSPSPCVMDYSLRTSAVNVSIGATTPGFAGGNDGAVNEGDQVACTTVVGTAHADTLTGSTAADTLHGGGGGDTFNGGLGSDNLVGGAGADTVTYFGRAAGVTVTKDNLANDGVTGELDNVRSDIERIIGTNFADKLTGHAGADWLFGRGGNDLLYPLGGADAVYGEDGNDTVYARDGVKDTLNGGAGTDRSQHDAIDARTLFEQAF